MKHIIQFSITREDGVYTADGINIPIATEGKTFEKLQYNIREAVELYFENENPINLGFVASPAILTNFELVPVLNAKKS